MRPARASMAAGRTLPVAGAVAPVVPRRRSLERRRRGYGMALLVPLLGLLADASPAPAATVDLARAEAWLVERVPALTTGTNFPVRTLALTAIALRERPAVRRLAETICARQRRDGFWRELGTAQALADQALGVIAVAGQGPRECAGAGARALLAVRRDDGGWSASMGRHDHADATSIALAGMALKAAAAMWPAGEYDARASAIRDPDVMRSAARCLAGLQDIRSGALGLESRAVGTWSATVAGLVGFSLAGEGRSLPARRAVAALTRPEVLDRPSRQPLLDAWLAACAIPACPAGVGDKLHQALEAELVAHQQPDGRWLAPGPQRVDGEIFATAGALAAARQLSETTRGGNGPVDLAAPGSLLWTNGLFGHAVFLISMPAEAADALLVAPDRLRGERLFVSFDGWACLDHFARRADDATNRPHARVATLAAGIRRVLDEGGTAAGTIPTLAARLLRLRPEPLLRPVDFEETIGSIDDRTMERIAGRLAAGDFDALLEQARACWSEESWACLADRVDALIPPGVAPAVAALRARAAERVAGRLGDGTACVVVLDAWLAFGVDGVLARLRAGGASSH